MAKVVEREIEVTAIGHKPTSELRSVRFLRRPAWDSSFLPGDVVGVPTSQALDYVLVGYAEPSGWTPTKEELRATAENLFRRLEADREAHGFAPEPWLAQRGMRKRYERVLQVLEDTKA